MKEYCDCCEVWINKLKSHLNSERHMMKKQKKEIKRENRIWCDDCKKWYTFRYYFKCHRNTLMHKNKGERI